MMCYDAEVLMEMVQGGSMDSPLVVDGEELLLKVVKGNCNRINLRHIKSNQ